MNPTVAKLVAAGLAIAAIAVTHFVSDPTALALLHAIAGGLVGSQYVPRIGDAPRSVHPDDMGVK
jgi:hypothetical protein